MCLLYLSLTFTNLMVIARRVAEIRTQQKWYVTQSSIQIFLPVYIYIVRYHNMKPTYIKLPVNIIFYVRLSCYIYIYIYTHTHTHTHKCTHLYINFSIIFDRFYILLLRRLRALQTIMNVCIIIQNAFISREMGMSLTGLASQKVQDWYIITCDLGDLRI
jgi:hypothetical protein